MNYRTTEILSSEAANTAGTKVLDINIDKPISRIVVQMKGLNNGSVPTAHPTKMISKIELVDGSDVLYSASATEINAINIDEQRNIRYQEIDYSDELYAIVDVSLDFGRYLYDPLLALDPRKFKNLQLKITHNKASGGSCPDAAVLSVFADVFDEKNVNPSGFLMVKEWYNYTLVASAHEFIDLPTDYPYRSMYINSLYTLKQPHENFNKVKLSEDNDARLPINNLSTSDLCKILPGNPYFTESARVYDVDAETTVYVTPTYACAVQGEGLNASDVTFFHDASYGGTVDVTGGAATANEMVIVGKCPNGALRIPFGKQDELSDWYDVRRLGNLRLDLTAGGSAVGTCQIVIQQFRNYR